MIQQFFPGSRHADFVEERVAGGARAGARADANAVNQRDGAGAQHHRGIPRCGLAGGNGIGLVIGLRLEFARGKVIQGEQQIVLPGARCQGVPRCDRAIGHCNSQCLIGGIHLAKKCGLRGALHQGHAGPLVGAIPGGIHQARRIDFSGVDPCEIPSRGAAFVVWGIDPNLIAVGWGIACDCRKASIEHHKRTAVALHPIVGEASAAILVIQAVFVAWVVGKLLHHLARLVVEGPVIQHRPVKFKRLAPAGVERSRELNLHLHFSA